MSTEMTEQEIKTAVYIVVPQAIIKQFKRERDYIRVWYSLPNDKQNKEYRMDLLPDDIYFVGDKDWDEQPLENGDILYKYHQLMVARGYSLVWKGNPYI